jgi:hypothetical protein
MEINDDKEGACMEKELMRRISIVNGRAKRDDSGIWSGFIGWEVYDKY